jgi:hypothetical protein
MKALTCASIEPAELALEDSITLVITGIEIAATIAITAMVISSSIRVKPFSFLLKVIIYFSFCK